MSVGKALGIAAIAFALAPPAQAVQAVERPTALRTFVSGVGSDSNTSAECPRANPCRTLAAAYSVTATGGEITALDPGDYGPLTITGQLSIFGTNGALIAVASSTAGITINAPAAARILIRNFIVSGAGATNTKGIVLNTGQLALLNSTLEQLSVGLSVSNTKADLVNTNLIANTTGVSTTGTGVDTNAFPMTGPTQVRVACGNTIGNTSAYVMNNPGAGTGGNKVTILEFLTSNTTAAYSTNMTGNANLVSGTGSSCGGTNCQNLGYYSSNTNPK
jgi:hypothetical protein